MRTPLTPQYQYDLLIEFALRTLDILEKEEDWNADTPEDITMQAIVLGLAHTDKETRLFTKNSSLLG